MMGHTGTALDAALVACGACELVSRAPPGYSDHRLACSRCGAPLRARKRDSVTRTWALVIAAIVLYFPANLLPITRIETLGSVEENTILSGVIYFIQNGDWPVALVIFVASIFVPLLKLSILIALLISVQRKSGRWRKERTVLYRVTEKIGRWSMVDVFVVTVLVALVDVGALANVDAGPAAAYFSAVVVLTMFAAASFDSRLIWDSYADGERNR